jgi:hypothetical protein
MPEKDAGIGGDDSPARACRLAGLVLILVDAAEGAHAGGQRGCVRSKSAIQASFSAVDRRELPESAVNTHGASG